MIEQRIGLAVMRCQPSHIGHFDILTRISRECDVALLGLGSTGNDIDENNPWTQVIRTQMIRNVFGDRIVIIPLEDLPKAKKNKPREKNEWVDYVLRMCAQYGYSNVSDYYTGSKADAVWYTDRFYNEEMIDPVLRSYEGEYTDEEPYITPDGDDRILHIIDRDKNDCPSATEIRTLISLGEEKEWKKWIPRVNHDIIMKTYPPNYIMR